MKFEAGEAGNGIKSMTGPRFSNNRFSIHLWRRGTISEIKKKNDRA